MHGHPPKALDQLHSKLLHTLGSEYHLLRRFYSRFAALPQLADYFAGPLHALPINNKMADFGGGVVEYRSLIQ